MSERFRLGPLELVVLGLFFLSGASALVYEVVWTRDLTNVFGGSAFAVATVLAAFMGGLALGSTLFGRTIDRRGNPLFVYGVLEAGIAVWAMVLPVLFTALDRSYAWIYQTLDPGFYTLSLIRFVLCFLVLLVPTTMMGGTLPVLGKLLLRQPDRLGQRAGLLYGSNTLGAVLGTAAGGFVLLPLLGLRGSTWVAVGINLAVAVIALVLARHFASAGTDGAEPKPAAPGAGKTYSPRLLTTVLVVYAASGFAALAYEVAWTKTLSMILGNTTYAFTAMLTTFLLGLSLGSFLFARLADRYGRPEALLALVQMGIPLLALATIPILGALPQLFVDGFARFQGSWFGLELYRILLAALTMFLPTVLMGGTFPLVTRIYVQGSGTGTRLGRLYAANTVGAIFGSFLTGFVLIPLLGRQDSILAASFVNLAAALVLVVAIRWGGVPRFVRWGMAAVALLMVPGWLVGLKPWNPRIMASGAYVYAPRISPLGTIAEYAADDRLLFYHEGTEATVSVWLDNYVTSLRINGKVDASSHGDMVTQKMLGHLPALYQHKDPKEGLVIGLASGISTGSLLTHPIEHVETVELIQSVEEAARYFDDYNGRCLDDPRHRLILNDARNHLLLTDKQYDVIVSEPPNPWIAGVGSLFTREFFELVETRLTPNGVVCHWLHTYQLREEDLKTILATFLDAYDNVHLWQTNPGDLLVVGGRKPLAIDLDRVNRLLAGDPGADLAELEILPAAQVLSLFVTDRAGMETYVGGWEGRVTDDNLYLEYAVPRHMFENRDRVDVTSLAAVQTSPLGFLTGDSITPDIGEQVDRYQEARAIAVRVQLRNELPPGAGSHEEAGAIALRIAPDELTARTVYSNAVNETAIQALLAGDVRSAAPRFREIADTGIREERAIALNNLGAIVFHAGDIDSARICWEAAVREEPRYTLVLSNLALVAVHENRHEDAITYLRKAVALDRDDPALLNNLAYHLALMESDLDEAETWARRAVELDPHPHYRDTLGLVLIKQGRWDQAARVLGPVARENPDILESVFHLGMARAGQGRIESAREAFQTVIQRSEDTQLVRRANDELKKL